MEVPEHLEGTACNVLVAEQRAAERRSLWAVILGLVPHQDGDQYCVLWGENLQEGIAAFGKSPSAALRAFEVEMNKEALSGNS